MDDDNLPLPHSALRDDPLIKLARQDLDPLSISELDERISLLRQEIARCENKKMAATRHLSAADALFKKI